MSELAVVRELIPHADLDLAIRVTDQAKIRVNALLWRICFMRTFIRRAL